VSPPAASTAAARTEAPPAPRPRRLQAAGAPARKAPSRPSARRATPGRRVSGPPRRVSGPARRPSTARGRTQAQPTSTLRTFAGGAAAAAVRLPDHRLLDRLVRGRYWIAIVGVALIGMVAMQVAMLKINSNIGAYVDKASGLERANAVLSAENSRLATVSRIEAEGAKLGLVLPNPDAVRYRFARPGDAANAVATMHAPTPATQIAQTATPSVTGQTTTSTTSTATGTPVTGTTTQQGTTVTPAQGTTAAAGGTAATSTQSQGTQPQGTSPVDP
jgi:hypothetical protein